MLERARRTAAALLLLAVAAAGPAPAQRPRGAYRELEGVVLHVCCAQEESGLAAQARAEG